MNQPYHFPIDSYDIFKLAQQFLQLKPALPKSYTMTYDYSNSTVHGPGVFTLVIRRNIPESTFDPVTNYEVLRAVADALIAVIEAVYPEPFDTRRDVIFHHAADSVIFFFKT